MKNNVKYDLEKRFVEFSVRVIGITERIRATSAGNILISQLIKSGTSPALNYGEAQAGESRNDFIHKLSICLKELRETRNCLNIIKKCHLHEDNRIIDEALGENEELILILYKSIQTAKSNNRKNGRDK